jgi:phenylpyruvate tautomerase PptA (4-oxalocrotonate tautomerase family)
MPFIDVHIFEERLDGETEARLLTELTAAVTRALGEEYLKSTWVVLQGTPAARWAVGGAVDPLRRDG